MASLFSDWFTRMSATMWHRVSSLVSGRIFNVQTNRHRPTMCSIRLFHWRRWAIEDYTIDRTAKGLPSSTIQKPVRISNFARCIFFRCNKTKRRRKLTVHIDRAIFIPAEAETKPVLFSWRNPRSDVIQRTTTQMKFPGFYRLGLPNIIDTIEKESLF